MHHYQNLMRYATAGIDVRTEYATKYIQAMLW